MIAQERSLNVQRPTQPFVPSPVSPTSGNPIIKRVGNTHACRSMIPVYPTVATIVACTRIDDRATKTALDALGRIVQNKNERYDLSLVLIDELGTDIWDVLKAHKVSVPNNFRAPTAPNEDWFARNHWIDEVCYLICREGPVTASILFLRLDRKRHHSSRCRRTCHRTFQWGRYAA